MNGAANLLTPNKLQEIVMKDYNIDIPEDDCDVVLTFPNGNELVVQCRPSNADDKYNGSLDIILPENETIVCWKGDDMDPSPASGNARQKKEDRTRECQRVAKQIMMELPCDMSADDGMS